MKFIFIIAMLFSSVLFSQEVVVQASDVPDKSDLQAGLVDRNYSKYLEKLKPFKTDELNKRKGFVWLIAEVDNGNLFLKTGNRALTDGRGKFLSYSENNESYSNIDNIESLMPLFLDIEVSGISILSANKEVFDESGVLDAKTIGISTVKRVFEEDNTNDITSLPEGTYFTVFKDVAKTFYDYFDTDQEVEVSVGSNVDDSKFNFKVEKIISPVSFNAKANRTASRFSLIVNNHFYCKKTIFKTVEDENEKIEEQYYCLIRVNL